MKKSILNLGKALNRTEQKLINGGSGTCAACTNVQFVEVNHNVFAKQCVGDLITGVSINEAQSHVSGGGNWCCDSCGGVTWDEVLAPSILPGL